MTTPDKQTIRDALCSSIAVTLQRSGRQIPHFNDTDKPVKGYVGFDSQCGVEVTLELEQSLNIEDLGTNIFVQGAGKSARARTISEIVDYVFGQLINGDQR
jgi:hypothetical protein